MQYVKVAPAAWIIAGTPAQAGEFHTKENRKN
jgi:hypothetical protein